MSGIEARAWFEVEPTTGKAGCWYKICDEAKVGPFTAIAAASASRAEILRRVEFAEACDEIWRQRVAKGDGRVCGHCFGGREDHTFEPDPRGGAIALCRDQEQEMLASHDREVAADLRRGS